MTHWLISKEMNGWNLRKEIHPSKPSKPLNFFRFQISCSKCLYSKPLEFFGVSHSEVEHSRYILPWRKEHNLQKITKKNTATLPLECYLEIYILIKETNIIYIFIGNHSRVITIQYPKSTFWTYCGRGFLYINPYIPGPFSLGAKWFLKGVNSPSPWGV